MIQYGIVPTQWGRGPAWLDLAPRASEPVVMELVPFSQHVWGRHGNPLLHPGGIGGFAQWGSLF